MNNNNKGKMIVQKGASRARRVVHTGTRYHDMKHAAHKAERRAVRQQLANVGFDADTDFLKQYNVTGRDIS